MRSIAVLRAGDYVCCLYETDAEHRAVLTAYVRQGLEREEKVIWLGDAGTAEAVLGSLRQDGLEVEPYLARGRLAILGGEESGVREGASDPAALIALLRTETERALAGGCAAVRCACEMSWQLRGQPGSAPMIEHEALLNESLPRDRTLTLCLYDRRRFEPAVLLDVLRTHRYVVIGAGVYENARSMPPGEFLSADRPAAELRGYLQDLRESRRVKEAVREGEELQQLFMDAMSDLAFLKDEAFRHVMVNRRYAAFIGKPVAEVLGKTDYELMASPMAEVCRRSDAEALAQGKVVSGEERVGETTFETLKFPVPLRGGGVGVGGFIRDVTEQRRAGAELAQERFLLQAFMNHVPDAVYFKDRDSRIIRISKAQARMFGVSDPAEVVGKTDFDFFTEEHARQAYEDEQGIIRTGQPVTKEERETWPDRPDTWVSTTKVPLCDEEGNVVGTFGISRSITERRRTEEALRESERRFQQLAETMPDPVLVGQDGKNAYANLAAARLLRAAGPEELIGLRISSVIDAAHHERAGEMMQRALAGDAPPPFEDRFVRLDGTTVPVEISVARSQWRGRPALQVIARDITERKQAEAEREQLICELRDALAKVKTLSGLLPICSSCKKIRDDSGYWNQLDRYVAEHSEAVFSHDICPECMRKLYPDLLDDDGAPGG